MKCAFSMKGGIDMLMHKNRRCTRKTGNTPPYTLHACLDSPKGRQRLTRLMLITPATTTCLKAQELVHEA